MGRARISSERMPEFPSLTIPWSQRKTAVYRFDTRHPDEIINAGGFWPSPGTRDYNLGMHHIYYEEKAMSGHVSAFVLTSAELENTEIFKTIAVRMKKNEENFDRESLHKQIIGYVYKVRPDKNFYDMKLAFLAARDACEEHTQRYGVMELVHYRTWDAGEIAAMDGFSHDRIIEYAPVRAGDKDFSKLEWEKYLGYKSVYDNDRSAEDIYTNVNIYHPLHAKPMAIIIVQKVLKIKRNEAKKIIENKLEDRIEDIVLKYNTNQEEVIETIKNLSESTSGCCWKSCV